MSGEAPAWVDSPPSARRAGRKWALVLSLLLLGLGLGMAYAFHDITFDLQGRPSLTWRDAPSMRPGIYQMVQASSREACGHCGKLLRVAQGAVRVPLREADAYGTERIEGLCSTCADEVVTYRLSHQCATCSRIYIVESVSAPRRDVPDDTTVHGTCSTCRDR